VHKIAIHSHALAYTSIMFKNLFGANKSVGWEQTGKQVRCPSVTLNVARRPLDNVKKSDLQSLRTWLGVEIKTRSVYGRVNITLANLFSVIVVPTKLNRFASR